MRTVNNNDRTLRLEAAYSDIDATSCGNPSCACNMSKPICPKCESTDIDRFGNCLPCWDGRDKEADAEQDLMHELEYLQLNCAYCGFPSVGPGCPECMPADDGDWIG